MSPGLHSIFAACLVAAGTCTGGASAAVVDMTYSDRSVWLTAVGGSSDFSESFNSFAVDTEFVTTTLSFSGFSLRASEDAPTGGNKVDVAPFGPGISTPSGTNTTPQANIQTGRNPVGENTVNMTFDNPITAWGAEFEEFGISSVIELLFADGTTQSLQIPESQSFGPEFLGFTSLTTDVVALKFMVGTLSGGNPIFGGFGGLMDNVAGNFGTAAPAVPEPASVSLMAGGLGALGLLGWRRKRTAAAAV